MIDGLTKAWRLQRLLRQGSLALAVAAALALLLIFLRQNVWIGTSIVFLLSFLGQIIHRPFWRITSRTVVQHLARSRPDFEESTHLLLLAPETFDPIARLQYARLVTRWQARPPLPWQTSPIHLRFPVLSAVLLVCAGWLAFRSIPPSPRSSIALAHPSIPVPLSASKDRTLALSSARITITPPAYLHLPLRTTSNLQLEAEEHSLIVWNLRFASQPTSVSLLFGANQRLPLVLQPDGSWQAGGSFAQSTIYTLEAKNAPDFQPLNALYALRLLPDLPPTVAVLAPVGRLSIDGAQTPTLPITVHAADDHGITRCWLVATIARGSGENVRFREREFPLQAVHGHYQTTLDLPALGMEPGDELYFHAEAADNRDPAPQIARSNTSFLTWPGPAGESMEMSHGVMVNVVPAFFRSQRQLIIDTEKLLADQPGLPKPVFLDRADSLGVDQHALRLRYGEFMGEESETPEKPPEAGPAPAAAGAVNTAGLTAEFGHLHDQDPDQQHTTAAALPAESKPASADPAKPPGDPNDILHEFGDYHDTQDTTSLFDREVRGGLRSALGQMWDAERYLRIGTPEQALPFEKEALRILKALDQSSRAYVQKVGFDPPPLHEAEDRLSGPPPDRSIPSLQKSFPAASPDAALQKLILLSADATLLTPELAAQLEIVRRDLVAKPAADPTAQLPVLQTIQELQSGATHRPLRSLFDELTSQLWKLLPPPLDLPLAPARPPSLLTHALRETIAAAPGKTR